MDATLRIRGRSRLDERLSPLRETELTPPPRGWIKAIREALGMTGQQFAARMGIKPPTVVDLEKSEALGTIQLKTLSRAADALGCKLVYALVPRTSLQDAVEARARKIAIRALKRVAHTMKLENQSVDEADLERQIQNYIRNEIKDRDLWADRD
ncbi:MAG: mobile mystery protein A [Hyphomicrobium sp.]|nr:mobile mystery protein A [Hyphomicrobium sp.]MBN9276092.1 mobile mystery protein A [Hyphomicrobium sp.]